MSEKRFIKKYPNRRLYDTAISSYITLEDVKELVLSNVDFIVIDARTKTDITHSTLLQIIFELEDKKPLLSNELLQHLVRAYGQTQHNSLKVFMDKSLAIFLENELYFKSENADLSMIDTILKPIKEANFSEIAQSQDAAPAPALNLQSQPEPVEI